MVHMEYFDYIEASAKKEKGVGLILETRSQKKTPFSWPLPKWGGAEGPARISFGNFLKVKKFPQ